MPLHDLVCKTEGCGLYGKTQERYFHVATDENPPCESCGGPTGRLISQFAIPLSGIISRKYVDKSKKEQPNWDGGHWAYARQTPDGKPRPVFIETFQQQREFCKSEGLTNPSDLPPNVDPSSDGKQLGSQGLPGCWI